MIETHDLTIKYNETLAIDGINIHIEQGEKISVIGQSGCGKTTFLHALAGILFPTNGSVTVFDETNQGIRNGTAIILQKDGLFPWKKVGGNVYLGIINDLITKEAKWNKVEQLLEELGILDQKEKFLCELSGGQRQRVAIARALIQNPDLLLMDEPSASLDMITKEKFQDSLHELYEKHGITAVMVTHDIEEAVYLGQRILVMDCGKIVEEVINPFFGKKGIRDSIDFYELCLKIRQVMKR